MSEKAPQPESSAEQRPQDPRQHPDYVPVEKNPDNAVRFEQLIRGKDASLDGGWVLQGMLGEGKVYEKLRTSPGKEDELGAVKWVSPEKLAERDERLEAQRREAGAGVLQAAQTAELMSVAPASTGEYVPPSAAEVAEQRRAAGMYTPAEIGAMMAGVSEDDPDVTRPRPKAEADEHPYAHLFDADGDKGSAVDVGRAARTTEDATEARRLSARAQADAKYNAVKAAGGTHEEANAAAERVWRNNGF